MCDWCGCEDDYDDHEALSPVEQDWVDSEIGEISIVVADIVNPTDDNKLIGMSVFKEHSLKVAFLCNPEVYSTSEVKEVIEMLSRAMKDYIIETRLMPLLRLDEDSVIH